MRPRLSWLAASLVPLALLAGPSYAVAAANHPFLGVVGKPVYEDACGLAFGPGGLYISDYHHDAIIGPAGEISPAGGPCKLAFDGSENLYVNEWHRAVVKYPELVTGAGQTIDEAQATGLAVDRASGDVFVVHRTYVTEYDEFGAVVATIGAGHLGEAFGIAVSEYPATSGYLYVPDAATHTVKVFDPAASLTEPVAEITGEATPQHGFEYLVDAEVVVDNSPTSPSYGHLYVLDAIGHGLSEHPEAALDEFNAAGEYRGQIAGFTDAEPSGVAIDAATGNVYLTSGNSEGSAVFEYGPTSATHRLSVAKSGTGGGAVTTSPAGIACGAACAAEFNAGQTVVLQAAPDGQSTFAGWTVTGAEACPGLGTCTVLMSKDAEVTAKFETPPQQTLTVSETGAGEGTVSSQPAGIDCPSDCEEHFAQGRTVSLTATPGPHSRFAEWLGPDCDEGTAPVCKVTMSAAKAVGAKFEPIPQLALSVTLSGDGQGAVGSFPAGISCPGSCSGAFDEGSTVYLLAAPAPGSQFAGFSGGGCSGTATVCAVAMAQAQNVGAGFTGAAAGPAQATAAVQANATARRRLHRRRRAWVRNHPIAIGAARALSFVTKGR